jgi:glycosyltransferase involved in cell wall biosynthesis
MSASGKRDRVAGSTIVICTFDRPLMLDIVLASVAAQTLAPDEVLVVDGSPGQESRERALGWVHRLPLRYVRTHPPGLTRQRNAALEHAARDVICFVDDDSVLDPRYLEAVMRVFDHDPAQTIGVVVGRVVEPDAVSHSSRLRRRLLLAAQRLFLLPRPGPGTLQSSGFQTLPHHLEEGRDVACVSGGAMSFRRSSLAGLAFDEKLAGAGEMEDVDIARQLAGKTRIRYEPRAVVTHRPSPSGRDPEPQRLCRLVRHHRYLYVKYRSCQGQRPLAFWWSIAGLWVLCVVSGRWASARALGAELVTMFAKA